MSVRLRRYGGPEDYRRVSNLLIEEYQPANRDGNWLEPAWEYMHSHSWLDRPSLARIGIWEDAGRVVAVAHYESRLGEAFFQFRPAYRCLRQEMLEYAEENLQGRTEESGAYLHAYVNDCDAEFRALVGERGYVVDEEEARPVSRFGIPEPFRAIQVPAGFRVKSLADDLDWAKVHRVLHRGFDHRGEPPADELEERKRMADSPSFRHDLKIVVEAPNGDLASFAGAWYEPANRYAYVEPVATDPEYRRMGLGTAAVLEAVRRCGALGATEAYVGSDLEFYLAMGFERCFASECWVKRL